MSLLGPALKAIQTFHISHACILAARVNLPGRGESLRITEIAGQRDLPVHAIFQAGVVEVAKRAPSRRAAARVTESPRLKRASAAIPEIVHVTQTQRMEFAGDRDLRMWPQNQGTEKIF